MYTESRSSGRLGSFLVAYTSFSRDSGDTLKPFLPLRSRAFHKLHTHYNFNMLASGGPSTFTKMPPSRQLTI